MTADPVTVEVDADLDQAMQLMDEHGVRHLPVLEHGRFVGLLLDRDLLEATGWLPRRVREAREGPYEASKVRSVREIMRAPEIRADPDDDVLALAVESVVQGSGCIPVTRDDRLLGIVTEREMLEAYLGRARAAAADWKEPAAADVMSHPARSIQRTATLGEARESCRRWAVRHLPVLEGTRLVGIVSDRDLRRAVGQGRRENYPVDELMTKRPTTVAPRAPISAVAAFFVDHRCSAMPVLEGEELRGIVTIEDLIDPCMRALA